MTAAYTTVVPWQEYRVTCHDHGLARTVKTEAHAQNLLALHLRRDHAGQDPEDLEAPPGPAVNLEDVDLTAAASMVVAAADVGGREGYGALSVWGVLTGLDLTEALGYARELSDHPGTVTATVPPF